MTDQNVEGREFEQIISINKMYYLLILLSKKIKKIIKDPKELQGCLFLKKREEIILQSNKYLDSRLL